MMKVVCGGAIADRPSLSRAERFGAVEGSGDFKSDRDLADEGLDVGGDEMLEDEDCISTDADSDACAGNGLTGDETSVSVGSDVAGNGSDADFWDSDSRTSPEFGVSSCDSEELEGAHATSTDADGKLCSAARIDADSADEDDGFASAWAIFDSAGLENPVSAVAAAFKRDN
jgi:hypothetical protein